MKHNTSLAVFMLLYSCEVKSYQLTNKWVPEISEIVDDDEFSRKEL